MSGVVEISMCKSMLLHQVFRNLKETIDGDDQSDWFNAPNGFTAYNEISSFLMPKAILEIGTRAGHSLVAMALGSLQLERIHFIDNESYVSGSNRMAYNNLVDLYDRVLSDRKKPEITFDTTFPDVGVLKGQYEIGHIDGEHSFCGKIRDLNYMRDVGVQWILVDDFYYIEPCRQAVLEWVESHDFPLYVAHSFRGLAIIRMRNDPNINWEPLNLGEKLFRLH